MVQAVSCLQGFTTMASVGPWPLNPDLENE